MDSSVCACDIPIVKWVTTTCKRSNIADAVRNLGEQKNLLKKWLIAHNRFAIINLYTNMSNTEPSYTFSIRTYKTK